MPPLFLAYYVSDEGKSAWWMQSHSASHCGAAWGHLMFGDAHWWTAFRRAYWWMVFAASGWLLRALHARIGSVFLKDIALSLCNRTVGDLLSGSYSVDGSAFKTHEINYSTNWREDVLARVNMCHEMLEATWAKLLVVRDKTGKKVSSRVAQDLGNIEMRGYAEVLSDEDIEQSQFPLTISFPWTERYQLLNILHRSLDDAVDEQPDSICGASFQFKMTVYTRAAVLHGSQIVAWSLTSFFFTDKMNCVGGWLSTLISVRELLYMYLLCMVLHHHPKAIVFNFDRADWKEKLLWATSPEKYFVLVLAEKNKLNHILARGLFLTISLVFDMIAVFILALGAPPVPMAIMLMLMAAGGAVSDFLGAIYGDWGKGKVSTAAAADLSIPWTALITAPVIALTIPLVCPNSHLAGPWFCDRTAGGCSCCCSETPPDSASGCQFTLCWSDIDVVDRAGHLGKASACCCSKSNTSDPQDCACCGATSEFCQSCCNCREMPNMMT